MSEGREGKLSRGLRWHQNAACLTFAATLSVLQPAKAAGLQSGAPGARVPIAAPAAQVDQLSWLVGHWEGEGMGGRSFETISPPVAGQMAGHFQQSSGNAVQFFEFYNFGERNGSLVLRIRHFTPDLTSWEENNRAVEFHLTAIGADHVQFDSVSFRLVAQDRMLAQVVTRARDGVERNVEFRFRRVRR